MSKGYRNGAFALGLAVGCGITLNLFLWLDYAAKNEGYQPSQADNQTNHSQIGVYWDGLVGTFVSPSDTLAQWIMAVFTIVVVFLVWKTLVATQEMALDTRRIGEAQVRAHISWIESGILVGFDEDRSPVSVVFEPKIKNWGQSPAMLTFYGTQIFVIDPEEPPNFGVDIKNAYNPYQIGAGGVFIMQDQFIDVDDADLVFSGDKACYLVGMICFRDVFFKPGDPDRFTTFCLKVEFRSSPTSVKFDNRDYSTLVRFSPRIGNIYVLQN